MAKFKTQYGIALAAVVGSGCYVGYPDASDLAVGGTEFADSNDDDDDSDSAEAGEDDGGDSGGPNDPGDGGDDSPSADDGGDDSPSDGSDGDDGVPQDDGGSDDGALPPAGDLASGIAFSDVQLNQGVVIEIVRQGEYLGAGQRNADIIDGRAALVRGLFETDGSFSPRTLEGRLIVTSSGGVAEVFSDVRQVDGSADASTLDGGFLWEIPTGVIAGDSELSLEILETDDAAGGASPNGGARIPSEGTVSLDTAGGEHTLSIVIVPLAYGSLTPDLGAANKEILEAALYEQNPVTDLDISYRQVTDYPFAVNNGNQLGDILGFLGNLKSQDGAGNEVYYAGVINVGCFVVGCGNAGTTGIGYIPSAQTFASNQRVSANVWFNPESSAQTVVHETGHNQGLNHVACPQASASGVDPAYPYSSGQVGGWGWGALSGDFHGSNSYDYMSYCGPSWVSDWTWNKTQSRIEALSTPAAPPSSGALLGHLYPDGSQTWFEIGVPQDGNATGTATTIALQDGGSTVAVMNAATGDLSDGGGRWVVAELPAGVAFDGFVLRDAGHTTEVDADTIRFRTP